MTKSAERRRLANRLEEMQKGLDEWGPSVPEICRERYRALIRIHEIDLELLSLDGRTKADRDAVHALNRERWSLDTRSGELRETILDTYPLMLLGNYDEKENAEYKASWEAAQKATRTEIQLMEAVGLPIPDEFIDF